MCSAGRGCGGSLFNYGGVFTSPMYPSNYRNNSQCRWDVSVPIGTQPVLKFTGKTAHTISIKHILTFCRALHFCHWRALPSRQSASELCMWACAPFPSFLFSLYLFPFSGLCSGHKLGPSNYIPRLHPVNFQNFVWPGYFKIVVSAWLESGWYGIHDAAPTMISTEYFDWFCYV
jgi:hypothetical protein